MEANRSITRSRRRQIADGWTRAFGCTYESIALFRITLGILLIVELVLRYRFILPFYSNMGTLPLPLMMTKVDRLYKLVCLHCHFGQVWQQYILLTIQVICAVMFTAGWYTRWTSTLSWYLYLSLTLRNTWVNYILDRYFHYLLFVSIFLPLDSCWVFASRRSSKATKSVIVISSGTFALKALVTWIYLDAGIGKYMDPMGGWFYNAQPLPALDTYARHTVVARYLYAVLGPTGLRMLTPVVLYVEILAAPVSLFASFLGNKMLINAAVMLVCALHIGIAVTIRNATLLSFVACSAWCAFLPIGWDTLVMPEEHRPNVLVGQRFRNLIPFVLIVCMVIGTIWLELISQECNQRSEHIWSTLFHNRWNVFVGAEEYVTWEIAPGLLQDGSVVDVWSKHDYVDWNMPGSGAPSTATSRPGRWRSFPYLAGLENEDGEALWSYLCKDWDRKNLSERNPGRKLLRYKFFMLQADVLPNMTFGATRKRLIKSYNCVLPATAVDQTKVSTSVHNTLKNSEELYLASIRAME